MHSPDRARVLVIGAGLIGSHVVEALLSRDISVAVLTRSRPSGLAAQLVRQTDLVVADCSQTDLRPLLDVVTDVVWTLGGLMPGEAEQDPELDRLSILQPLTHLLAALRERPNVSLTMVTSGGTAYGHSDTFPTPETAPARPVNSYGRVRVEAEQQAIASSERSGHGLRILRVSNVYGPGQLSGRGQGFLGHALDSALSRRPFTVFGDGSEIRDFVLVSDVGDAVARLMSAPAEPRILNLASGKPLTLMDALNAVREVTGVDFPITFAPARGFDVARVELDISRLTSLIDYRPTDLRDGLSATWRWLTATTSGARTAGQRTGTP